MYISRICNIESVATKKKFLCSFVSNNKIFTYCVVLLEDLAAYGTLLMDLCIYDIISWRKKFFVLLWCLFMRFQSFYFHALFLTFSLLCYVSYFIRGLLRLLNTLGRWWKEIDWVNYLFCLKKNWNLYKSLLNKRKGKITQSVYLNCPY